MYRNSHFDMWKKLSHRTNKPLIYVYEIDKWENGQKYFQSQDEWILFDRHEVSTLEYVRKDQELEKNSAA